VAKNDKMAKDELADASPLAGSESEKMALYLKHENIKITASKYQKEFHERLQYTVSDIHAARDDSLDLAKTA
jgi:hypothetical protein